MPSSAYASAPEKGQQKEYVQAEILVMQETGSSQEKTLIERQGQCAKKCNIRHYILWGYVVQNP